MPPIIAKSAYIYATSQIYFLKKIYLKHTWYVHAHKPTAIMSVSLEW